MLASCPGDEPRGLGPDPRCVPGQHCWSPAPDPAHQARDHEHDDHVTIDHDLMTIDHDQ